MHDPNLRLRILLLVFGGLIAGSAIIYWRSESLVSAQYVEFPVGSKGSSYSAVTPKPPEHVRKDLKGYEDLYK